MKGEKKRERERNRQRDKERQKAWHEKCDLSKNHGIVGFAWVKKGPIEKRGKERWKKRGKEEKRGNFREI